jgi:hypothetical protein
MTVCAILSPPPALSLDLYAWATRRVSYLKRPLRISWASFQLSFGGGLRGDTARKVSIPGNAIEALHRVKAVYPQLKIETKGAYKGIKRGDISSLFATDYGNSLP